MTHLVPKLRISGTISPVPHTPSGSAHGQLYRLSLIRIILVLQYQLMCWRDQNRFRLVELICRQGRSDTIALTNYTSPHRHRTKPNQIWLSSTSGLSPVSTHNIYLLMSIIYISIPCTKPSILSNKTFLTIMLPPLASSKPYTLFLHDLPTYI
jgi:hypothetical protein